MTPPPYLFDPEHWDLGVSGNIPTLALVHLGYTALALAIGAAIAMPIGFYLGHTGRFAFVAINASNAGRSLPTLGLITLLVTLMGLGLAPVTIALVVLAVPPILTATYAAVQAVDPATVDAARGMGMRERQILFRVEIPIALPLLMGGLRGAALQIVATATVAAYVGLGGLGRLLIDGLALDQYDRVIAGAVVVAVLAILVDLFAAGVQRLLVSPGVSGRALAGRARRSRRSPVSPRIGTRSVG